MRGFICLTAHPEGCEKNVIDQIEYIKSKGPIEGPKNVLVIGASTGFGLASRITAAFGSNACYHWRVSLKNPLLKVKRPRQVGIIVLHFKNMQQLLAYMQKVLMAMPSQRDKKQDDRLN
jgi:trans-2-enoyl-CoA reductase